MLARSLRQRTGTHRQPRTEFGHLLRTFRGNCQEPLEGEEWPNGWLSQRALAKRVGIRDASVANLECGGRLPSRRLTYRLATALQLNQADTDRLLHAAGHLSDTDIRAEERFLALSNKAAHLLKDPTLGDDDKQWLLDVLSGALEYLENSRCSHVARSALAALQ